MVNKFVLIPGMGLVGAALATVLAYVLILVGSFLAGRKLFSLPLPVMGLVKILASCAVWALILWPVRDNTALTPVLLHCLVGAVGYLVVFCGLDVGNTRRLLARVVQVAFGIIRPSRLGLKR
jgi:hypothetical protein